MDIFYIICLILNWSTLSITQIDAARRASPGKAGKALPGKAERYVKDFVAVINPNIEWDPSNYLTSLSGDYATCDAIGMRGFVVPSGTTPEGETIRGISDFGKSTGNFISAVTRDSKNIINKWLMRKDFLRQIRVAKKFGCSIRPNCKGKASFVCLFSPSGSGYKELIRAPPQRIESNKVLAHAFTVDQYRDVESILAKKWDKTHLLENLSGHETSCEMTHHGSWAFARGITEARRYGVRVLGQYGIERNERNTDGAVMKIIKRFKKVSGQGTVGCSLIPDCPVGGQDMFVVVSCLFEEI